MQNIELLISGMSCGACQNHVARALQNAPGVKSAEVDLQAGTAMVLGSELDIAALLRAVEDEGYGAQIATPSQRVQSR